MNNFISEEGYYFSDNEYLQYINWKVPELLKEGKSYQEILLWENNDFWIYNVEKWFRTNKTQEEND